MAEDHNRSDFLSDALSNRPLIVGVLFLASYLLPLLAFIGIIVAYVFKQDPNAEWEASHFQFLIRTFWLAVIATVISMIMAAGILLAAELTTQDVTGGDFILISGIVWGIPTIGALILCGVRVIISLTKAASRKPIARPRSLLG